MTSRTVRGRGWRAPGFHSFSLVELLVAMAILSILVIVLLSMLGSLTTIWQAGQAHNERRTNAQAVLERISRDLSQAALPLTRTATNGLELVINPSGVSATYEYPQAVFWQAPVATDSGVNGNLAVVGYFIQWLNGAPSLCRLLINPSAADYDVYSAPNAWITDALLQKYASGTATDNYAGLLADNVIGLWFQALDPQGIPIQQGISPTLKGEAFDSRYPYTYTNFTASASGVLGTNVASAMPASMQIAIAVIDSRTARRLALSGKPTYPPLTGNFWADVQGFYNGLPALIQKGTEIQTITVPLANGPR